MLPQIIFKIMSSQEAGNFKMHPDKQKDNKKEKGKKR